MIVAGPEGCKTAYRRFNIRNVAARPESQSDDDAPEIIEAGDDFAMMRQVLSRRFARLEGGPGAARR